MHTKQTIFLIHGAGSIGLEWKNFEIGFRKQGFNVLRAKLRHHQLGSINTNIGNLSLNDYLSDLEKQIEELDHLPIVIGHSMGGLLALKLCERNKSKLGILITPAAPAGINAISLSVLRIFISNIFRWKFWRKPGYIGFRSADHLHRVDLVPEKNTMTLFIPGPFGLRKNKRAGYNKGFKN